jgi:hypothetical protein
MLCMELGPVMPNSMEMWLAPASSVVFGHGQRMRAIVAQLVDFHESEVFGGLAAHGDGFARHPRLHVELPQRKIQHAR